MSDRLTTAGLSSAAKLLGVSVAAIKAVIAVETAGGGFLADGRPKILFERHVFHRLTGGVHDANRAGISNRAPGGYNEDSYRKYYVALQLAPEAAVDSCSWGLGQIMGFNWPHTGEKSRYGFLAAMHHNEDVQLMLMAAYIANVGLADELRAKNWAGFAKGYNGPLYKRNAYDVKLAKAYAAAGGK